MDFEGLPLPDDDTLPTALVGADQARLVRAAVVHSFFAGRVIISCTAMLADERAEWRGTALRVGHALLARALTGPLSDIILNDSALFYGVPDPVRPERTLAESAVAFLGEVASPSNVKARAALRHALGRPALAALAWKVVGGEDADAVLPHLGTLLTTHPSLAAEAGTRFALLFTDRCEAAARAVAPLPEATRRVFGEALQKHLMRIHAVKRWVECRRVLFGQ